MIIDKETAKYVAGLSRLEIPDDKLENVAALLGEIVEYFDILNSIDTDDVGDMSHALEISNVFREDTVKPSFDRAEIIKNAPQQDGTAFLVPKTVE